MLWAFLGLVVPSQAEAFKWEGLPETKNIEDRRNERQEPSWKQAVEILRRSGDRVTKWGSQVRKGAPPAPAYNGCSVVSSEENRNYGVLLEDIKKGKQEPLLDRLAGLEKEMAVSDVNVKEVNACSGAYQEVLSSLEKKYKSADQLRNAFRATYGRSGWAANDLQLSFQKVIPESEPFVSVACHGLRNMGRSQLKEVVGGYSKAYKHLDARITRTATVLAEDFDRMFQWSKKSSCGTTGAAGEARPGAARIRVMHRGSQPENR